MHTIQKYNIQKGFSLIELIVVVAIIGIMTAVLLVSMTQGRAHREVEIAARNFSAALRQAQNNALTGVTYTNSSALTYYPCYFTVRIDADGYAMTGTYHSEDNASCSSGGQKSLSYKVEKGVVVTTPVDEVFFSVPFGEPKIDNAKSGLPNELLASVAEIIFIKGNADYYICIHPSGQIEESSTTCK